MKKYVDGVRPPIDPIEVEGWNGRSDTEMILLSIFYGVLLGIALYATLF